MQTTRYQQADEAIRRLTEMGKTDSINAIKLGTTILDTVDTHTKTYFVVDELMKNMRTDWGEFAYATIRFEDTIGQHIYVLYVGQDTDNWQHEFSADNGVFRNEVLDIVVHKPELSRYTAVKCVCENGELKIIG